MFKAIRPLDAGRPRARASSAATATSRASRPDSQVETFAAVRLDIDSWRWQGVPFYIRAGKCLPVTCTEVIVEFRRPPPVYEASPRANYCPLPHQPGHRASRLGAQAKRPGERMIGSPVELLVSQHHEPNEMDAYERLIADAMEGDATLFAREDYVEAAWRIVDPVRGTDPPQRIRAGDVGAARKRGRVALCSLRAGLARPRPRTGGRFGARSPCRVPVPSGRAKVEVRHTYAPKDMQSTPGTGWPRPGSAARHRSSRQGFDAWGLETGKELHRVAGEAQRVAVLSPDERTVAAVSQAVGDGPTAVRLWYAQDLRRSRPGSPTCDQAAYSSGRVLEVPCSGRDYLRGRRRDGSGEPAAGWRPAGWCIATTRRWSPDGLPGEEGTFNMCCSG